MSERERAMREAFPLPIVTVVVSEGAVERWLHEADPRSVVAFEEMRAAGVVEVRS